MKTKLKQNKLLNLDTIKKLRKIDILNLGLEFLSVDINYSLAHTTITKDNKLLLGFDDMGIDKVLANKIIASRKECKFSDFDDLIKRVPELKDIDEIHLKRLEASTWQNIKEYIKMQDLKDGYIYKIIARNTKYGVWIKEKNGFMISRWKFNSNYLFIEFHWDFDDLVGTAKPIKLIDKFPFEIKEENEYNQNEAKEILSFLNCLN